MTAVMNGHPATTPTTTTNTAPAVSTTPPTQAPTPLAATPFLGYTQPVETTKIDHADLLLRSPSQFAQTIMTDVDRRLEVREQQKSARDKMWTEFYSKNPDLKDIDWEVQSVLGENLSAWKDKSVNEATELLAQETRRRIDLIRKKFNVKEEILTPQAATALPTSGETQPEVKAPPVRPKSFVDEILEARKKKSA